MARCVCIRCLGKGECYLPIAGAVNRCPLCLGLGVLGGVDGDCAEAVAAVYPAQYLPDAEEEPVLRIDLPEGVTREQVTALREEWRGLTRRPVSQETKSIEQRYQALEAKYERLLARVETLEMRGTRSGGRG